MQLTDSCADFMKRLLCHDIEKRLSASEALKHEWISGGKASTHCLATDVLQNLTKFNFDNKLQYVLVNCILSELEGDDKQVLSKGLLSLNRETSVMDNASVVEYLLLHSTIDEDAVVKYHSSHKLLNLSPAVLSPAIHDTRCDSLYNYNWDCIDIDVDKILDEVEQKEKELEAADGGDDTIKIHDEDEDDIIEVSDLKILNPVSPLEISDKDSLGDISDTEINRFRANDSVDFVNKRISTGRFRAIMSKADKQYNVEDIVHDLDDGTGHIPLSNISSFHKNMSTVRNIFGNIQPIKMDVSATI